MSSKCKDMMELPPVHHEYFNNLTHNINEEKYYRVRQMPFLEKKLLNIFQNFLFYLKIQSFRLIMKNNFIQMAASAGHAVANTIDPIFKHIIDCVQLYFTNGFTNIVL